MDRVKEAFTALKVAENHFQNAEAEYVDAAARFAALSGETA